MKNGLATFLILSGLATSGGCASNLGSMSPGEFSPDDAMKIRNVDPTGRVANADADALVTPNMRAAVLVVGLSEMSRMVDSARGQVHDRR